jgi:hypothetical protein
MRQKLKLLFLTKLHDNFFLKYCVTYQNNIFLLPNIVQDIKLFITLKIYRMLFCHVLFYLVFIFYKSNEYYFNEF